MKFLANKKLAARTGIVTTVITLAGMLLLWLTVSTNDAHGRFAENVSGYHLVPTGTDKSGNHEIARNRQYDFVHVQSDF